MIKAIRGLIKRYTFLRACKSDIDARRGTLGPEGSSESGALDEAMRELSGGILVKRD
jgi:hypothetical protein